MNVAAVPQASAKALVPNSRQTTTGLSVVTCPRLRRSCAERRQDDQKCSYPRNLCAFAADLHSEQRTYSISTGTGCLELIVMLFSPENFTSYATSETTTPSEHAAITFTFGPSSCIDLTVHF
jgi:hypothetical protein